MGTADLTPLGVASQLYDLGVVRILLRYCRRTGVRTCAFTIFTEIETIHEMLVHHEKQSEIIRDEEGRVPS
jgi:hypothetical protein